MISFFKQLFGKRHNEKASTKKKQRKGDHSADITVMLIGIDNAGKTSILSALQGECDTNTTPTVGFNRETIKFGKYNITYFDLGGGKSIRKIWRKYYAAIHAAIFVVDSSDEQRLEEAREVLFEAVQNPFFCGKSVLILANKQDVKTALSPGEIADHLRLTELTQYVYRYNILPCSAVNFDKKGVDPQIKKGLSWLSESIDEDFEALSSRIDKEAKEEEERERKEKEEKMQRIRERKEREAREEEERIQRERKEEEAAMESQANEAHNNAVASTTATSSSAQDESNK